MANHVAEPDNLSSVHRPLRLETTAEAEYYCSCRELGVVLSTYMVAHICNSSF